ncbi:phosphate ABC transporter substrate-binding protein PstS [Actinoplanes sp. NPDC051861]|uniref:phosphate ABC transporter substrate-binding protein PstS n=1 Tax=Actinoplanes sp. NPDC051861 TaxID=3155170 RepID=UPI00344ACFCD
MNKLALLGVLGLALAGCSSPPTPDVERIACAAGSVSGQGSSAQTNVVHAWIMDYQISCADSAISYESVGSGAGVQAFAGGAGDFAGTDAFLSAGDQKKVDARCDGPAVHLPLVVSPVALAYNVAGAEILNLSPAVAAKIFSGAITVWNDPTIVADNKGVALPATRIRPIHRSDNSGTTANFTKFLSTSPEWSFGSGSTWPVKGGAEERGSHRVAAAIARTDGAIGYIEASFARAADLPAAWLGDPSRGFSGPSDYATGRALENASIDEDLRIAMNPSAEGYPLVAVTYEVVCATGTSAAARSFLAYAAGTSGQQTAVSAGYVPLPEALRARVAQVVAGLR